MKLAASYLNNSDVKPCPWALADGGKRTSLVRGVGLLYSCQTYCDIKLWQTLLVRNSFCKRKGKAYSFISGGFAFDIRRLVSKKAGEQF